MIKITLLFIFILWVFSQYELVPPNQAKLTSLSRITNISSTGRNSLDIPISNHKNINISLTYSSNGFKPYQTESIVGLDWALNAGGYIMQQAVSKYDSYSKGKLYSIYSDQPDYYSYNFLGKSGHFIVNRKNSETDYPVVYSYPRNNWDIKFYDRITSFDDESNNYWDIIDDDGIQYSFRKFTEKTRNNSQDRNSYVPTGSSVILWYIDRVIYPNGSTVTFEYSNIITFNPIPEISVSTQTSHPKENILIRNEVVRPYKIRKLKSINFDDGYKLNLIYDTYDHAERGVVPRLEKVEKMYNSEKIEEIILSYKYEPDKFNRLFLKEIENTNLINSSKSYSYQFSYFNEDYNLPEINLIGRQYGTDFVESYSVPGVDKYNYYNGTTVPRTYENSDYIDTRLASTNSIENVRKGVLKKSYTQLVELQTMNMSKIPLGLIQVLLKQKMV